MVISTSCFLQPNRKNPRIQAQDGRQVEIALTSLLNKSENRLDTEDLFFRTIFLWTLPQALAILARPFLHWQFYFHTLAYDCTSTSICQKGIILKFLTSSLYCLKAATLSSTDSLPWGTSLSFCITCHTKHVNLLLITHLILLKECTRRTQLITSDSFVYLIFPQIKLSLTLNGFFFKLTFCLNSHQEQHQVDQHDRRQRTASDPTEGKMYLCGFGLHCDQEFRT